MSDNRDRFLPTLETLDDRVQPAVLNYGGPLLTHVEAQAVYLGSEWAAPVAGQPRPATVDASLADLVGGAYMDALTRAGYGVGRGTASAGVIDPTAYAPDTMLSDAAIQARLQADISTGRVLPPDANRLYVVYVQPNVAVNLGQGQGTTQTGVLGDHGAFAGRDAAGHPVSVRYAVVAYPGGTVGNTSAGLAPLDQLTAVASHEVAESVTDPDVDYGQLGWYDPAQGEIGDITADNPASLVRLDGYLVQEVANQQDGLLAITTGSTPTKPTQPVPVPTPRPTTTATTVTITPGPVSYGWWFTPPTENVTITVTGSAAAGGTIALVADGTVIGATQVRPVNGVTRVTFTLQYPAQGTYALVGEYIGVGQSAQLTTPVFVFV